LQEAQMIDGTIEDLRTPLDPAHGLGSLCDAAPSVIPRTPAASAEAATPGKAARMILA
jgi:hypothetical protein